MSRVNYSTLLERRVAPHPFDSRLWGRGGATAVVFRSADWCSGDSRLIGTVAMVPMKTSQARAVSFFARRSAHTAVSAHRPLFLSKRLPPSPRCAMHSAQKKTSGPPLLSGSWNRRCKVLGARRVVARSPPSRRSRVAHLNACFPCKVQGLHT